MILDNYITSKLGGLNNSNCKLKINTKMFFYRAHIIDSKTNFIKEHNILKILNKEKLTPRTLFYSKNTGVLISEYIEDGILSESTQNTNDFLVEFSKNLKRFHSLSSDYFFNPFNEIKDNFSKLIDSNYNFSYDISILLENLKNLEYYLTKNIDLGFCHNDLNPSNVLVKDNNILFIDFEYSGMGDIFYDIATFSWLLNRDAKNILLNHYFGEITDYHIYKFNSYMFVAKLWNASWSYLKDLKDNSHDYDYKLGADMIISDLLSLY